MKKKRLILISGAVALVFVLVILLSNFYLVLLAPLDVGEAIDPEYGDAILIMGGGLRPKVEIGISTEERLWLAVQLFKQKRRTVILSDGSLYKKSPAIKKMAGYFEKHGVPRSDLIFEGLSQNTFESCLNCKDIVDRNEWKEVIVVTSPYHQKRSEMIMRYLQYPNFRIAGMKRSEVYQADTFSQRMRNLRLIFRDYIALLKFWIFKK